MVDAEDDAYGFLRDANEEDDADPHAMSDDDDDAFERGARRSREKLAEEDRAGAGAEARGGRRGGGFVEKRRRLEERALMDERVEADAQAARVVPRRSPHASKDDLHDGRLAPATRVGAHRRHRRRASRGDAPSAEEYARRHD